MPEKEQNQAVYFHLVLHALVGKAVWAHQNPAGTDSSEAVDIPQLLSCNTSWLGLIISKVPLCVCAKPFQSCPTYWDFMDCSPPGSSVPGILQARILEWVAVPSSRGFSRPRDQTLITYTPALTGKFFTTCATWEGTLQSP